MGRYRKAALEAAQLTNKELGSRITELAPMNMDRLKELLPDKTDKEEFVRLMSRVEDETKVENQLAYLRENLQTAGKVVFKALKFFI